MAKGKEMENCFFFSSWCSDGNSFTLRVFFSYWTWGSRWSETHSSWVFGQYFSGFSRFSSPKTSSSSCQITMMMLMPVAALNSMIQSLESSDSGSWWWFCSSFLLQLRRRVEKQLLLIPRVFLLFSVLSLSSFSFLKVRSHVSRPSVSLNNTGAEATSQKEKLQQTPSAWASVAGPSSSCSGWWGVTAAGWKEVLFFFFSCST